MSTLLKKIEYSLKHNVLLQKVYIVFFSIFFRFIGLFIKIDDNKVFITANSQGYNDSPQVLYESLIQDERFKDVNFVWALDPSLNINLPNAKVIKFNSFNYFKEALSSKVWIASVNIERGLQFKKSKTKFLNTWHGIAINHMGNAVNNRTDFDWSKTDVIPISNDYEIEIFKRDFLAKETSLLKIGLPRNDALYHSDDKEKDDFKIKNGISLDKKLILYAPTWRDSEDGGMSYAMKLPITWEKWEESLSKDYHMILRLHPNAELSEQEKNSIPFDTFVYDAKNDNIIELMKASDLLISDYSSTIMDYSITEKPIFSYGYDYEQYKQKRGFYYNLDGILPNGIIKTEKELLENIINIDFEAQSNLTRSLKAEHAKYGGDATRQLIEILNQWLN